MILFPFSFLLFPFSKATVMNNLEIEINMVKVIRKALSILLIISAVTCFIGHYTGLSAFDIIYSVFMLGAGIVFLLGNIGTEKILIRADEASIFIKWVGEIRGKQVLFNDIDRPEADKNNRKRE